MAFACPLATAFDGEGGVKKMRRKGGKKTGRQMIPTGTNCQQMMTNDSDW